MIPAALESALRFKLRHDAPFEREEIRKLDDIQFGAGSTRPYGCEHLPNLRSVAFGGCGEIDFRMDLGLRPGIHFVSVWTSMLSNLDGISGVLPGLSRLDFTVCQVRDLKPLLQLQKLRRVVLGGNPLDEFSFREIYPDFVRRRIIREINDQSIIREQEWELMQLFVARGLKLSAYKVCEATSINAPGHTVWQKPEGMGVDCTPAQAMKVLNENPGIDEKGYLQTLREVVRAERRRK